MRLRYHNKKISSGTPGRLQAVYSKLRLLKFTRDDVSRSRIQGKNELRAAERLQKALEQQIDNIHEQMVEIQAL